MLSAAVVIGALIVCIDETCSIVLYNGIGIFDGTMVLL